MNMKLTKDHIFFTMLMVSTTLMLVGWMFTWIQIVAPIMAVIGLCGLVWITVERYRETKDVVRLLLDIAGGCLIISSGLSLFFRETEHINIISLPFMVSGGILLLFSYNKQRKNKEKGERQ